MEEIKLEEVIYDEVTLTGDEIEQLKAVKPVEVSDTTRAMYHNNMIKHIQESIRKSAKNKEKELLLLPSSLFSSIIHPVYWQKEIIKDIVKKLKERNVNIVYKDDSNAIKVII